MELYYTKGGSDYVMQNQPKRGLYIHFSIVELEKTEEYTTEKYSPFDDSTAKEFILPLKQKNRKKLEKLYDLVLSYEDDIFDEYLAWNDGVPNRLSSILEEIKEKMK